MSETRAHEGWHRLHADGAARGNPGPAAYGFVLDSPDGAEIAASGEAIGEATNNVAEYRGLIAGLERALALGVTHLETRMDSELVVRQMTGEYRVKHPGLIPLHQRAKQATARLGAVTFRAVRREENARADGLVNATLDGGMGTESPR